MSDMETVSPTGDVEVEPKAAWKAPSLQVVSFSKTRNGLGVVIDIPGSTVVGPS